MCPSADVSACRINRGLLCFSSFCCLVAVMPTRCEISSAHPVLGRLPTPTPRRPCLKRTESGETSQAVLKVVRRAFLPSHGDEMRSKWLIARLKIQVATVAYQLLRHDHLCTLLNKRSQRSELLVCVMSPQRRVTRFRWGQSTPLTTGTEPGLRARFSGPHSGSAPQIAQIMLTPCGCFSPRCSPPSRRQTSATLNPLGSRYLRIR